MKKKEGVAMKTNKGGSVTVDKDGKVPLNCFNGQHESGNCCLFGRQRY